PGKPNVEPQPDLDLVFSPKVRCLHRDSASLCVLVMPSLLQQSRAVLGQRQLERQTWMIRFHDHLQSACWRNSDIMYIFSTSMVLCIPRTCVLIHSPGIELFCSALESDPRQNNLVFLVQGNARMEAMI
ncbi:hypothetical protein WG66_007904, partial [Moniliophthora roreri]